MRIAVLGAGAWGTALATRLAADRSRAVCLWGHRPEAVERIDRERVNPLLPGVMLAPTLRVTADLARALDGAQLVLLAAPAAATAELAQAAVRYAPEAPVLSLAKGFVAGPGEDTLRLVHEAIEAAGCGEAGILAGPSFASETARGLPLALVCVLAREEQAQAVARGLRDASMRIYAGTDRIGVALCGAIKNVYAIGAGVSDGLGLGANARAALVTRALAELRRLVVASGGAAETVAGLAGVGDLMLTTGGDASRNRQVGLALARGDRLERIVGDLGHVAEGVATATRTLAYAARHGVEMPIAAAIAALIEGRIDAATAIRQLLERAPRGEF
ncbi:MAG: NAD(P)H-dependent glycerol-3-phosphate dehydrogenase [Casimicrobiaceae bacterium]